MLASIFAAILGFTMPLQSSPTDYSYADKVTGCEIDESFIQHEIQVPSPSYPSLAAGFSAARELLVKGESTRVVIAAGVYRESVLDLNWMEGRAADTLLVIEGEGKVVWSGSDIYPLSEWNKEGELYSHTWDKNFGNFAYSWGPKHLIGHRVEQIFIDGQPLFQRILEQHEIGGVEQNPEVINQVSYSYSGFLSPSETLKAGQFGVAEREENKPSLWFKPPDASVMDEGSIEVSVRKRLLDLVGKNNVVLRNITFQHCANDDREFGSLNPVTFGLHKGFPSKNVLIEKCQFLWNSGTGLMVGGENWTIRGCTFNFNGYSGIASGKSENVLFQNNETSFNVWRAWRGGEIGYFTGGFKMHETSRHRVEGHLALGNCTGGAWWDVHCLNVYAQDMVLIDNAFQLQFELGTGPFWGHRLVMAGGKYGDGLVHLWAGATKFTNSIFYSDLKNDGNTVLYGFRLWDRNDPHSNMMPIHLGPQEAYDNLFIAGSNLKAFAIMDDIRDKSREAHAIISYIGRDNIFWHPRQSQFWNSWVTAHDREAKYNPTSIETWLKLGGQTEQNPRQVDPEFMNPNEGDFRINPASSLFKEKARWPSFKLSEDKLKEMRWFFNWSGFDPESWDPPVKD